MRFGPLLAAASALALAGCGDSAGEPAPDTSEGSAQGEIFGGSAGDAMVATDQLRSKSPSLEPEPSTDGGSRSGGNSGAGSAEPGEPAEPVPQETPEPAVEPEEASAEEG